MATATATGGTMVRVEHQQQPLATTMDPEGARQRKLENMVTILSRYESGNPQDQLRVKLQRVDSQRREAIKMCGFFEKKVVLQDQRSSWRMEGARAGTRDGVVGWWWWWGGGLRKRDTPRLFNNPNQLASALTGLCRFLFDVTAPTRPRRLKGEMTNLPKRQERMTTA